MVSESIVCIAILSVNDSGTLRQQRPQLCFTFACLPVVGNHCLYVGREALQKRLNLDGSSYYTKELSTTWTLVALDTVYIGVERNEGDPRRLEADKYLQDHAGEENAVLWNGALGSEQTNWLKEELSKARSRKKRVVVCGHHPLVAEAAASPHVIWNAGEALQAFSEYNDVVAAYFCGHYHSGGSAVVDGIHHLTFPAILDSDESNVCLAKALACRVVRSATSTTLAAT